MPANLTLWGLMQWDDTIFDEIVLPEYEFNAFDLINEILLECAELEIVYPDPDFMKRAINTWSATRVKAWEHYVNIMRVEYSPIENSDRYEIRSITRDENENSENNNSANNNSTYTGNSNSDNISTSENQVSAYDSNIYVNSGRNVTENNNDNSSNEQLNTKNEIINKNKRNNNEQILENNHTHGNIGVTTNQTMLRQEVDFWKWDIYKQIAIEFRTKFCICVY